MIDAATTLRRARRRAGLSQRALASEAEVRQPLISRIERGRELPSLKTLGRLVRACGYDVLIELEPVPDSHELSLIESNLRLNPTQRVDRLIALHRTARDLQKAVRAAPQGP